jgi:hypothetical protein
MAHDHNGRVGPPRCEECNAPLNSDDRRSAFELSRSLCVDCYCALYPFPVMKKKRRRACPDRSPVLIRDKCQGTSSLVP